MALWNRKADMPTGRYLLCTCVVDGRIYAIGGFGAPAVAVATVEEYDPATDTWTTKTEMPTKRGFLACAAADGRVYVLGGNTGPGIWGTSLDTVEVYDPATDRWTVGPPMSAARDGAAASAVDGRVYAIAGAVVTGHESYDTLKSVEVYDPTSATWVARADLSRGRDTFSALAVDGGILVVGGFVPYGEMYDPTADAWSTSKSIPSPRIGPAAAAVAGKVYVFGGDEKGGGPATSRVFVYDVEADEWAELAPMPFAGLGMSAAVVDGKVYVIGGSERQYPHKPPHLATVWEYDPTP
jgi:N-acetylneuraminic acid mutarotase